MLLKLSSEPACDALAAWIAPRIRPACAAPVRVLLFLEVVTPESARGHLPLLLLVSVSAISVLLAVAPCPNV